MLGLGRERDCTLILCTSWPAVDFCMLCTASRGPHPFLLLLWAFLEGEREQRSSSRKKRLISVRGLAVAMTRAFKGKPLTVTSALQTPRHLTLRDSLGIPSRDVQSHKRPGGLFSSAHTLEERIRSPSLSQLSGLAAPLA